MSRTIYIFLAFLTIFISSLRPEESITASRRNAIVRAAEKAGPAVVSISVISTRVVAERPSFFEDPFFGEFWKEFFPPRYYRERVQSLGSGFIIDEEGHIVTNEHVVKGAEKIKVTLSDGRVFDGQIVGTDERRDLALLKIEGKDLPVAELGNSDSLLIGEWVIAIGNPFGYMLEDLEPTVTVGVVSALHRTFKGRGERIYRDMIQTDAAINPGNSGGPLVNSLGQVIGVNTFIITSSGGSEGIGFAIPINLVKKFVPEFEKYGKVREGYLGVMVQNLTDEIREGLGYGKTWGVAVTAVDEEGPFAGKLSEGDIIEEVNGRKIYNEGDWEDVTYALIPGEEIELLVNHEGREIRLSGKASLIEENPEDLEFGILAVTVNNAIARKYNLYVGKGVLVLKVRPGSRAYSLGLARGDVILKVNNTPVNDVEELKKALKKIKRGGLLRIYVDRFGTPFVVTTYGYR